MTDGEQRVFSPLDSNVSFCLSIKHIVYKNKFKRRSAANLKVCRIADKPRDSLKKNYTYFKDLEQCLLVIVIWKKDKDSQISISSIYG